MDENTVLSLLESISGSDSLRKKFLDALQGPVQQHNADATNLPVVSNHPPPASGEGQLVANERQSGKNNYSSGNPLGDGAPQYAISEESTTVFDPNSLSSEDDFTFDTHQVIVDYLEKHFRTSLYKDV